MKNLRRWFEHALVDRTGQHDLAQLRSLQDWFLKYELQTVPGVAEVATIVGMVRQYQVVVDPDKLRAFGIPLAKIKMAIQMGNQETGGSVIEMGEAEYMVRATGYIQSLEDLEQIPRHILSLYRFNQTCKLFIASALGNDAERISPLL